MGCSSCKRGAPRAASPRGELCARGALEDRQRLERAAGRRAGERKRRRQQPGALRGRRLCRQRGSRGARAPHRAPGGLGPGPPTGGGARAAAGSGEGRRGGHCSARRAPEGRGRARAAVGLPGAAAGVGARPHVSPIDHRPDGVPGGFGRGRAADGGGSALARGGAWGRQRDAGAPGAHQARAGFGEAGGGGGAGPDRGERRRRGGGGPRGAPGRRSLARQ
ncbi:unnamed protein product, partial [Prorocentrum cordatum]